MAASVKLMIQPGDGVGPLVKAIDAAKSSIEVVIFRLDHGEIERALVNAAQRGVFVHALIAFANRGGEKMLRKLESRFLARGISVARTADDLVRYHGKMMIVDRKKLYLLAFNFTHLDMDHSRSFGLVISAPALVQEAVRLFECDAKRQPYTPGHPRFLVSPVNARPALAELIKSARKELLIYDVEVSDRAMLRLLQERQKAGVAVRVLGWVGARGAGLEARELDPLRLHTRTVLCDGATVFVGSQSLRELELNARREIGVILRDRNLAQALTKVFEADWKAARPWAQAPSKAVKEMAKAVSDKMPSAPAIVDAVQEAIGPKLPVPRKAMTEAVNDAVKEAVKEAVEGAMKAAAPGEFQALKLSAL